MSENQKMKAEHDKVYLMRRKGIEPACTSGSTREEEEQGGKLPFFSILTTRKKLVKQSDINPRLLAPLTSYPKTPVRRKRS